MKNKMIKKTDNCSLLTGDCSLLAGSQFIKQLELLSLLAKRVVSGNLKADRKTKKKGSGINFADYAEYSLGDDYRNIDWNIYARLENLVVKLFELEEDVSIYIILDLSPSMQTKLLYAKKLAAAISYIALNNLDKLAIYGISDTLHTILEPSHGRGKIFPMLNALENAKTVGNNTLFSESLKIFQARHKKPGVCVLLSDFFVPDGYSKALNYLSWSKHEVFAIQVLDKKELSCDVRGDVELECEETKRKEKFTIGPVEAAKFAKKVEDWNLNVKKECAKNGIGLIQTDTEVPFENVIQNILRRGGLVS